MRRSFVKRQRLESYTKTQQNTQNSLFADISILDQYTFTEKVFSIRHNSLNGNIC